MRKWLLPEYIDDLLPTEAEAVERIRRRLLDHFALHGYRLVRPPLLEHLESLLTGTGRELDLYTFKVVDQLSGRLLGLRADTTLQVARIDAHLLNAEGISRLCYAGSVLHTRPMGLAQTREVMQVGAELYGHAGIAADREVLRLMLSSLTLLGVPRIHLDLGHVGVFRALVADAALEPELAGELFAAMRAKNVPRIGELTRGLPEAARRSFQVLPELYGEAHAVLERAARELPALPQIGAALADLRTLVGAIDGARVAVQIDLAELRDLDYHNGVVFSAYASGAAVAIGRGGRYDNIGAAFGRARPATGFSLYPRQLAQRVPGAAARPGVLAPDADDPALLAAVVRLRAAGEMIVAGIEGAAADPRAHGCDRRLALVDGVWQVQTV
ncbi:MAG: ATP phosphoribosyltransferase regulatory subunit [Betaproteobacteria bacterium]|nr:ATP phosphoribosyltransferase regulatory subunit [Betaproteobacteria bacterium]